MALLAKNILGLTSTLEMPFTHYCLLVTATMVGGPETVMVVFGAVTQKIEIEIFTTTTTTTTPG
eukprot:1888424-Amphidinium_carterae.1